MTAITVPIVLTTHHQSIQSQQPHTSITRLSPSYSRKSNAPLFALNDFPDPGLINHNGTWFAYGTNPQKNNATCVHVPVATSTDFLNWTLFDGHDALPTVGGWEMKINHWAPDVIQRGDGRFLLYYSGEKKGWAPHHCVGVAVSEGNSPLGPYTAQPSPLACPRKYGGAIDPSPFRDVDGTLYVTYKADGNSVGHGGYCGNSKKPLVPVPIMLQRLESAGVTPVGKPAQILNIIPDDGPLVEAPNIIRTKDGTYYLFFSSHCFNSPQYNVKYAHSASLHGPYRRAVSPLFQTGDFGLVAPGGATASVDGTKMVFHANCKTGRCMFVTGIEIMRDKTIIPTSLV